jgi:hypothetical protein
MREVLRFDKHPVTILFTEMNVVLSRVGRLHDELYGFIVISLRLQLIITAHTLNSF